MQQPVTKTRSNIHWTSAIQFALSALAFAGLFTTGMGLALAGFVQYFSDASQADTGMSLLLSSAGLLLSAVLLIPSAAYSLARLVKPESPLSLRLERFRLPLPGLLILAFPLVLWLGNIVVDQRLIAPFLLPPLHLLAIGLPVLWLLNLAKRKLPLGSAQRTWGIFAAGLVLSPALILILEIAVLMVLIVIAIILLSLQPELAEELEALALRFQQGTMDPEALLEDLTPYLTRPAVIYAVLVYVAGLVPLIEEALKPLGVWLLVGRNPSPAAGFAAGALCGTGYALFESLALATAGGDDWAAQVFVRSGTGIIHIVTTGLTGYALALAWRENRYVRLGLAYLLSVTLHSLWNGLTVVYSFSSLLSETNSQAMPLVSRIGSVAPFAIVFLGLIGFILLLLGNRLLRRTPSTIENTA